MKITALKSGKFAHPEPAQGNLELEKGEDYTVDDKMAGSIITCGWGKPCKEETPPEDKPLHKMKKSELIKFAEKNAPGMDPELKNDDMVTFIKKALEAT